MNIEIEAILPHRPPFLWVDRVQSVEPGVRCVASKHIELKGMGTTVVGCLFEPNGVHVAHVGDARPLSP